MSFKEARPRLAEVFLQYQEGDASSLILSDSNKKSVPYSGTRAGVREVAFSHRAVPFRYTPIPTLA